LPQCRLDYSVNHSVVVDTILARILGTLFQVVHDPLALQRVRKLQEQTAISDDPIASF
jgi:hypothetical protein